MRTELETEVLKFKARAQLELAQGAGQTARLRLRSVFSTRATRQAAKSIVIVIFVVVFVFVFVVVFVVVVVVVVVSALSIGVTYGVGFGSPT